MPHVYHAQFFQENPYKIEKTAMQNHGLEH